MIHHVASEGSGRCEPLHPGQATQAAIPVNVLDIRRQVERLKTIEDGWLEGAGKAPDQDGLDWLVRVFADSFLSSLPSPHLYPTESGGVLAEWSIESKEVSLEIDLITHDGEWHVLDPDSGDTDERRVCCDDDADWKWLAERIESMVQDKA